MRIEKVVVQNINSLYGRFEIDFTHEAYTEGLFAIVGPSGAGKSTVLDAMCLALYGRTPRVTISDMHDETMNKNADICVAEVVFVSGEKRYRSTFEHRRTIRSAKPFMSPRNELFEVGSDGTQTPLSDNATEARRKITEIVGLDYDQFTRSVMLAQFKFAEFLSANSGQRAEILEQVSGTDIYRRISVAVYQKQKSYKTSLDEIRIKKETINVLEPEQVKNIETQLQSIDDRISSFEALKSAAQQCSGFLQETETQQKALAEFEAQSQAIAKIAAAKDEALQAAQEDEKSKKLQSSQLNKTLVKVRALDIKIGAAAKEITRLQGDLSSADQSIREKKREILGILQHHLPSADDKQLKEIYEADNEGAIITAHISTALKAKEEERRALNADMAKLLQDQNEKHWRDKQTLFEQALPLLKAKQAIDAAQVSLKSLRTKHLALQEDEKQIDKLVLANEEKFLLAKLTEKYADERSKLVEGQPCPLCGAKQHTSAHEHMDTSFVKTAEEEKKQLDERKSRINGEIAKLGFDVNAQVKIIADSEDVLRGNDAIITKLETDKATELENQIVQIKQLLADHRALSERASLTDADVLRLTKQLAEVDKDTSTIRSAKAAIAEIENKRRQTASELEQTGENNTKQQNERKALFGDKNADEEEAKSTAALENAENQTAAARQGKEEAHSAQVRNINDIERTKAQITSLGNQLAAAYSVVVERASLVSAAVPIEQTDHYDAMLSLVAKLAQSPIGSAETLVNLSDSLKALSAKLNERKGGARTMLSENESKIAQIKALDKQEKEDSKQYARWSELNSLIGSADGIKFSRIAQGITFDVLLQYANESLKKMSDRYILLRDSASYASPLEINVVDNYQAGDIRPVSNLSGGESFVVSMALALGLSEMSSGKTQIDSLFIDEGFASLDENYLELALQTLSTLGNRENKLIGVISHVKELKERIDTQIEVCALPGGRSTLKGPGVSIDERYIL